MRKKVTRALTSNINIPIYPKSKRSQEEMVGFIIIVVLIAVILLVFLGFMIRSPAKESLQSYEVESFIQTALQYTSGCEDYSGFMSLQKMITEFGENEENTCKNGEKIGGVLDSTLNELIKAGWNIQEGSAIKGYEMKVFVDEVKKIDLSGGDKTGNYKGSSQEFPKSGKKYMVSLNIYYS